jgi:hypothetical protein
LRCLAADNTLIRWDAPPALKWFHTEVSVSTCRSRTDRSVVYACVASLEPPGDSTVVQVARVQLRFSGGGLRRQWSTETVELRPEDAMSSDSDDDEQEGADDGKVPRFIPIADHAQSDSSDSQPEDHASSGAAIPDTAAPRRRRRRQHARVITRCISRNGFLFCLFARRGISSPWAKALYERSALSSRWHRLVVWDCAAWKYADVADPRLLLPSVSTLFRDIAFPTRKTCVVGR